MTEVLRALDLLKSGGLTAGPEWEEAHEIAQAHEGDHAYDWVHALCHRIEGDAGNAAYWYRRAGRAPLDGDVEAEWIHIRETLAAG